MTEQYRNFAISQGYILEGDFNNLLDSLPSTIKNSNLDFSSYYYDDDLVIYLFSRCANIDVDDYDINNKSVRIYNVCDTEDLNRIIKILEDWTIENLDEIINEINSDD